VEIRYQIEDLPQYIEYLAALPPPLQSDEDGRHCIFTGAGDSLAAALAAEALSKYSARCLDPYEICRQPSVTKNTHLHVISVSGRTRLNIESARTAKGFAKEVTALTANPESTLAKSCDSLIELRFRSERKLTPGTGSFTASLLACYSRIQSLPRIQGLSDIYDEALSWSREIKVPLDSSTFFVATGLTYPLAVYGKAKIYEVLGSKAQSQRTEQFSHMELFSLTKNDLVIMMPEDESDTQAKRLHSLLKDNSIRTALLPLRSRNEIEESIRKAIFIQVLAWTAARDKGISECAFINQEELLKLSDRMIYPS